MNVDTDGNRMVWDETLRQWVPVTGSLSPAELANEMMPSLSSRYLVPALRRRADAESMGKAVGVGTKGVIALRFDDDHDAFQSTVYPLLAARGLPAAHACISVGPGDQSWWSTTTWAQVRTWNRNGVEIWSHGKDHRDPTPGGDAALVEHIVDSKTALEAQQLKVQGWMQPGVTALTDATPYGTDFTDIADMWNTRAGQLIMETYPLSEAYGVGVMRPIPNTLRYGLDHITIDTVTLANLQIYLAQAARYGYGIEFMLHSSALGQAGKLSVADFTTFLDNIVTEWNAGTIEVLTPSGLAHANRTTYRMDLISDGSFEATTTGDTARWLNGWGSKTIETSGGRTGANFLRIPSGDSTIISQRALWLSDLNLGGETFVFEGWARSDGTDTSTRLLLQDYEDNSRLNLSLNRLISVASTWTRVRHAFSLHPSTRQLTIGLAREGGTARIDWDDVSIRKV